jgi:hypothetical protein
VADFVGLVVDDQKKKIVVHQHLGWSQLALSAVIVAVFDNRRIGQTEQSLSETIEQQKRSGCFSLVLHKSEGNSVAIFISSALAVWCHAVFLTKQFFILSAWLSHLNSVAKR